MFKLLLFDQLTFKFRVTLKNSNSSRKPAPDPLFQTLNNYKFSTRYNKNPRKIMSEKCILFHVTW